MRDSMRQYTFEFTKETSSPVKLIKWMRRNFGERGSGWDFDGSGTGRTRTITILIWDQKMQVMYEMWHM